MKKVFSLLGIVMLLLTAWSLLRTYQTRNTVPSTYVNRKVPLAECVISPVMKIKVGETIFHIPQPLKLSGAIKPDNLFDYPHYKGWICGDESQVFEADTLYVKAYKLKDTACTIPILGEYSFVFSVRKMPEYLSDKRKIGTPLSEDECNRGPNFNCQTFTQLNGLFVSISTYSGDRKMAALLEPKVTDFIKVLQSPRGVQCDDPSIELYALPDFYQQQGRQP